MPEKMKPVKDFPGIVIAEEPQWKDCIQGSTGVVNLAGLPISTRWSPEIKKEIKQSRIKATSKVVDLINKSPSDLRPTVFVSATAVGYYGTSETQLFDEQSPSGKDYLSEVCREWEGTALGVDKDVRLALIRIGVVLGKDGGALAKMIPIFMMFAGGPLGSGKQWISIGSSLLATRYFKTKPTVPDLALKAVLGEGAVVVLEGQRVVPTRAKELGFSYQRCRLLEKQIVRKPEKPKMEL
ncbi:epimerase family protein SDR39U1 homolog, chloroplastic [Tanacetum coccineum]